MPRIVLVGLPTIAQQLHAGVADVIWVSQAYLFASTLGLLLIGRTTDFVGRVKIYNYGFVIFTIGSGLAALSFTSLELIGSRMVQGVGEAMIITNAAAILTDATPRNELGKILGMNSVAFRLGTITGLTLSGVILSITDWRALFYINIPIGIFGTVWAHYRLKEISTRDTHRAMDWVGFVSFSGGLGLILLALTYLSFGLSGLGLGFGMLAAGVGLMLFFVWYRSAGKKRATDTRHEPLQDQRVRRRHACDVLQRDRLVGDPDYGLFLPSGDRRRHSIAGWRQSSRARVHLHLRRANLGTAFGQTRISGRLSWSDWASAASRFSSFLSSTPRPMCQRYCSRWLSSDSGPGCGSRQTSARSWDPFRQTAGGSHPAFGLL